MAACLPGSGIVLSSASCSSPTSRRTYLLPSSSSAFASCKSHPHPTPTLSLSVEALSKSHLQVSPCIKLDADEFKSGLRSLVREGRDFSLPCNKRQPLIKATATEAPPLPLPKQKIRIKLRSYWTPLIEQASKQILDAAKSTNAKFMGPVPLPTKRRIYCVLRSPHVDKDSREHFEIRTHSRLIDIDNPTAQTIDALMQLDIPAGVDVEVKL